MDASVDGEGRTSRRAFLGCTAGVVGGVTAAGLGSTPVAAAPTPTVMTWNVYLGGGLGRLSDAESLADVRTIAGDMLAEVDPPTYAARADAIAAAIDASDADVVALQEAIRLRTQTPGDFGAEDSTTARTVVVDVLDMIVSALESRGREYEIAATTVTTDVELPADTQEGPTDLRMTDRDVLLVRGDHETSEAVTNTYAASVPLPVPGISRILQLRRGYCSVETTVDGVAFTAVSTHLESISNRIRVRQAEELLEALPTARPVVLCGDFNSGPHRRSDAYDRLTTAFDDAHTAVRSGADGFTCCQSAGLENDRSRLERRFDLVLYRGGVRAIDVGRVGHSPEDRVTIRRNGEQVRLWPSDHAGVVATLEIPAATPQPSNPTSTPRATSTDSPPPSPTQESGPGLGVGAAVAGAAGLALVGIVRQFRDDR